MLRTTYASTTDQPITFDHSTVKEGPAADQTFPALKNQEKEIVFQYLTSDDGLTHNSVFHVLQDRLAFTHSLSNDNIYDIHYGPDNVSLRRYDEHNGLLSNALEQAGGYLSPIGEIFVGADSPLQRNISVTKKITLPSDYTALTLEFAALNYRTPAKNQYAYMLDGFDSDRMQSDSTNRMATYTNLDPGEDTFRVNASNNDGVWNEEGTALAITSTPPWLETWCFRSAAVVTLLAMTFAGYRQRISNIEQRS